MSELESLSARAAELSSKADFWNNAVLVSLLLTAVAAAAIVVSQRLAFVRAKELTDVQAAVTRLKEIAEGTRRAEADARIAEAQARSAQANERATNAQASLSLAEQHAAEANAKAEGFRLDIAKANERAAAANETAEKERLARLQLEARLADRVMTDSPRLRLRTAFSQLKGQTVDVAILGDTLEIATFSGAIVQALKEAGVLVNEAHPLGGGPAARGVLVGAKSDASAAVKQAADSMIQILRETVGNGAGPWKWEDLSMGWNASVSQATGALPLGQATLRIFVGSK